MLRFQGHREPYRAKQSTWLSPANVYAKYAWRAGYPLLGILNSLRSHIDCRE
ncbi:hypothetical protein BDV09DRAFT_173455 [Aspergillus tetrazonus]